MAGRALKIVPKKRATKQSSDSTEQNAFESASESAIAHLAHRLWMERGSPIGSDQDDWFKAEQEVKKNLVAAVEAVARTKTGSATENR